jgi:zinc transport system substrate-binding protein
MVLTGRVRTAITRMLVAALVALVALAAGCGATDDPDDGRLAVVASFYPLAEAAERAGGDLVEVTNLTPAGTEPHDLELSPDQVDAIEDADLVVFVGGGFQPAVEDVVDRFDGKRLDVLDALGLDGTDDPHFWLDPERQADAVAAIESALADLDPDDAATFGANTDRYRTELETLDQRFAAGLADCERHEIVTTHAAFGYLADRYGLDQVAISGISPEAEPDPGRIADLADDIERRGVTTVFYESLVPPDLAETLAREAGVATAVLDPLEGLSEDELDGGASYLTVMEHNLDALREALGCR